MPEGEARGVIRETQRRDAPANLLDELFGSGRVPKPVVSWARHIEILDLSVYPRDCHKLYTATHDVFDRIVWDLKTASRFMPVLTKLKIDLLVLRRPMRR